MTISVHLLRSGLTVMQGMHIMHSPTVYVCIAFQNDSVYKHKHTPNVKRLVNIISISVIKILPETEVIFHISRLRNG